MIPRSREASPEEGLPIGGFLLVIGAWLVIAPFTVLFDLIAVVRALFSQGADLFDPSLLGVLRMVAATDAIMSGCLIWLGSLFFRKKAAFRAYLPGVLILSVLICAMNLYMARSLGFDDERMWRLAVDCVLNAAKAAALIPYIRLSRRVRRTFVR